MALVRPVRLLVNAPIPVPSDVCDSTMVGLSLILQQTPFVVKSQPLSSVISPPEIAVVESISETITVLRTGGVGSFAYLMNSVLRSLLKKENHD